MMDIGALFLGLALLVGSLVITFSPLQKNNVGYKPSSGRSHKPTVDEKRQAALAAIRDLDFDYSIGKISQEDYPVVRAGLIQQAARFTTLPADEERIEAMINARREKLEKGRIVAKCPNCGKKLDPDDQFCSSCGTPLAEKCPGCGKSVVASDMYCSSCGRVLHQPAPVRQKLEVAE